MTAASRPLRALGLAVGTGLGAGYSPLAPGTAGSALGVLIFAALAGRGFAWTLAAVAATLVAGTWAAGVCGRRFDHHDDGRIVVDEVAGQLIALAGFPASWPVLTAGFLLFRLYDIWKPPPARRIDREWRSAGGVMADDVVAGLYANLTLQGARALGWL